MHVLCFRASHNSRSSIVLLWAPPSRVKWVRVFLPMKARQKSRYASMGETFLILGNIEEGRHSILGAEGGGALNA